MKKVLSPSSAREMAVRLDPKDARPGSLAIRAKVMAASLA
jgi:hypothetical protein